MVVDALLVLWVVGGCAADVDVVRAVLVHEEHIAPTTRTLAKFVDELLSIQLQQGRFLLSKTVLPLYLFTFH